MEGGEGKMARRIGAGPSAGAWSFLEEVLVLGYTSGKIDAPSSIRSVLSARKVQEAMMKGLVWKGVAGCSGISVVYLADVWGPSPWDDVLWLCGFMGGVMAVIWGVSWVANKRAGATHRKKLGIKVSQAVREARRGDTKAIGADALPFARALRERERTGYAVENALPDGIEIAWDRRIEPHHHRGASVEVEAAAIADNPLQLLLGERLYAAHFDAIGMIMSTSGGVIVGDIKYWPGTVSMKSIENEENSSRRTSIENLVQAANVVNSGEVAAVLVIVCGGKVRGGAIRTVINGRDAVVAEFDEAVKFIREMHSAGCSAVNLNSVLARTPWKDGGEATVPRWMTAGSA